MSLTLSLSSGSRVILKEWSFPNYWVMSDLMTVPHGREGVGVDAGWEAVFWVTVWHDQVGWRAGWGPGQQMTKLKIICMKAV